MPERLDIPDILEIKRYSRRSMVIGSGMKIIGLGLSEHGDANLAANKNEVEALKQDYQQNNKPPFPSEETGPSTARQTSSDKLPKSDDLAIEANRQYMVGMSQFVKDNQTKPILGLPSKELGAAEKGGGLFFRMTGAVLGVYGLGALAITWVIERRMKNEKIKAFDKKNP